jgi:hypothetical protein
VTEVHCDEGPIAVTIAQRCPQVAHQTIWSGDQAFPAVTMKRGQSVEDAPANEVQEEAQKIRRLQIMVSMVMSVISQDPNLTIEEASELVAGTKRAALAMFPDKELAYDILYKPRLQRLMNERFHLQ